MEHGEVAGIEGVDVADSRDVPGGGDEGIQETFAAEPVLGEPIEPLPGDVRALGKEENLPRVGPETGDRGGGLHVQGAGEAARVGDDMEELGKDAGGETKRSLVSGRLLGEATTLLVGRVFGTNRSSCSYWLS